MSSANPFNCLLVPTDFSDASREAFDWACDSIGGSDASIVVLHVLDESLIEAILDHGLGNRDHVVAQMRRQADEQLTEYKQAAGEVAIDIVIGTGLPFLEIVRKSDDFAVDAIVMSKVGKRGSLETLLFGSTAEKVLRGSRKPVIVITPTSKRE